MGSRLPTPSLIVWNQATCFHHTPVQATCVARERCGMKLPRTHGSCGAVSSGLQPKADPCLTLASSTSSPCPDTHCYCCRGEHRLRKRGTRHLLCDLGWISRRSLVRDYSVLNPIFTSKSVSLKCFSSSLFPSQNVLLCKLRCLFIENTCTCKMELNFL